MQNFGNVPTAVVFGIVLLLARPPSIGAEYYSSIDSMEELGNYEADLIGAYRQYVAAQQEELNKYRKFVEHVRIQHQAAFQDVEDYLGNPLQAFATVKRVVADWTQLSGLMIKNPLHDDLRRVLGEFNEEMPFPDYNEVSGAVRGLARLQKMYNLNATDLASGEINGIYYESELTPRDCFVIATNLFDDKDYPLAVSWFEEVLKILNEEQKQNEEEDKGDGVHSVSKKARDEAKPEETRKPHDADSEDGQVEDVPEVVYEKINKVDQEKATKVNSSHEEGAEEAEYYDDDDNFDGDEAENSVEYIDDDTAKERPKNKLQSGDDEESEEDEYVEEDSHDRSKNQRPIKAEPEYAEYYDEESEDFELAENEDTLRGAPKQHGNEAVVHNEGDDYVYEESDPVSDKLEIESLEYLVLANYRLGRVEAMTSYIEELLKILPDHQYNNLINYQNTSIYYSPVNDLTNYANYSRLCQGKQLPERVHHKLKCTLETKNSPIFTLAPLKTEELSLDPAVMIYHNLLSDSLIERILEEALETTRMERSMVNSKVGGDVTEDRVSQQTWLSYSSPTMQLVYRIASDVTGFDLRNAEVMQVANYGIGGQYNPHHDYFSEGHIEPNWIGNRIATCMFYLSEVEQGGYTVFPQINVYSAPIKGAMVMWHNLHRSLDSDARTLHAGCPVIKGTKRIGNIWTHSGYQEFRRPCALVRDNFKSFGYV